MNQQFTKKRQTEQQDAAQRKEKSPPSILASIHPLVHLQQTMGNHGVLRRYPTVIQPKLKVSSPNDKYEREADRMADQVMSMPDRKPQRQIEDNEERIRTKPLTAQITRLVQRQPVIAEDAERQFWLSLGRQPHYRTLDKRKRTPMAIITGDQAADELLWTLEAGLNKAGQMRTFLKAKFGEDKNLRVTSVVKPEEHTRYRKMDVVPAGSTTWEELAAAAVHAGFWVHAEGVTLYGKDWPLSPEGKGAHFDLYLIRKEVGDFPLPSTIEESEEETIQTKEASGAITEHLPKQESSLERIKGRGLPLSESIRASLEPRFGFDFSHVRVHNDLSGDEISRALNARAFTLGNNIVFRVGQYAPETREGLRLLAHELTHVVQQGCAANDNKEIAMVQRQLFPIAHLGGLKGRAQPAPAPLRVGGDTSSDLIVLVAWTFDDGPTQVTERMKKELASVVGTWFIQRDRIQKGVKGKNIEELSKLQAKGHEIGIHSVHPTKPHLSWFPSNRHESYGDIDDALTDLRSFCQELNAAKIHVRFVRLPYGLVDELKEYLEKLENSEPELNAKRLIRPERWGEAQGIGVSIANSDLLKMQQTLNDLGLLLWGGDPSGRLSLESWEAESSGVPGRKDTITSHITFPEARKYRVTAFENTVTRTIRDKKQHSIVILAHDLTDADVQEVGSDIETMESYAKAKKVRVEYYSMSDLYRLVVKK